jgi:hypothetical protein
MDPNILNQIAQQAGQLQPPPMPKDEENIIVQALIKQLERIDKRNQMAMPQGQPMVQPGSQPMGQPNVGGV